MSDGHTEIDVAKTVFFVTPIGAPGSPQRNRSDDLLHLVIEPVVAEFDPELVPVRADQLAGYGSIPATIIKHLQDSAYIVCDVTGRNPNVYLELGIAFTLHKKVILFVDATDEIPFDTSTEAHIPLPSAAASEGLLLGRDVTSAKLALRRALDRAKTTTTPTGPVAVAMAQLTPPDISQQDATQLLQSAVQEHTARLDVLERAWRNRDVPAVISSSKVSQRLSPTWQRAVSLDLTQTPLNSTNGLLNQLLIAKAIELRPDLLVANEEGGRVILRVPTENGSKLLYVEMNENVGETIQTLTDLLGFNRTEVGMLQDLINRTEFNNSRIVSS